jgi:superoxide dismutase, Cu-Zn family
MRHAISILALAALAGCQTTPNEGQRATAQLKPTSGNKTIGEATFEQVGGKVKVFVFAQGLKPNSEHGLHIHEVGDCSDNGNAAKGHFNPGGKMHGRPGSGHAGDLPSMKANAKGRGNVQAELSGISVGSGSNNIVNRAVVIHAGPDDFKTQPTGDSGARIACGVIQPG